MTLIEAVRLLPADEELRREIIQLHAWNNDLLLQLEFVPVTDGGVFSYNEETELDW